MQEGDNKSSPRRIALGVVLGLAIGLLIESSLVVMLRLPILYFVVTSFGLIIFLPIAGGIKIGILFVRKMVRKEVAWPSIFLLALVLWPTTIALPFGVHILRLRSAAHTAVPAFPGARHSDTTVDLGDGENTGDSVRIGFKTGEDMSSIVDFYRAELARRGWEEGPRHFIETKQDDTPYWFSHKRTFESMHIKFGPLDGNRRLLFEVIYGM